MSSENLYHESYNIPVIYSSPEHSIVGIEEVEPVPSNILIRQVGKVNWSNSKPRRAGLILYDQKGVYLGVDNRSKELTDFGGEINYINEDTISGSLREYSEETLGAFPQFSWFNIFSSYAILSDSIVIFLVKVDDIDHLIEEFRDRKSKKKLVELDDILHLNWKEIETYPIYDRIKPLLLYALENYDWK